MLMSIDIEILKCGEHKMCGKEIEEIKHNVLKMRERIDRQRTLLIRSPYNKEKVIMLNKIDQELIVIERVIKNYITELSKKNYENN